MHIFERDYMSNIILDFIVLHENEASSIFNHFMHIFLNKKGDLVTQQ